MNEIFILLSPCHGCWLLTTARQQGSGVTAATVSIDLQYRVRVCVRACVPGIGSDPTRFRHVHREDVDPVEFLFKRHLVSPPLFGQCYPVFNFRDLSIRCLRNWHPCDMKMQAFVYAKTTHSVWKTHAGHLKRHETQKGANSADVETLTFS